MSENIADILARPSQGPTTVADPPWGAPTWEAKRFGSLIPGYELGGVMPRLMEPEGNGSLGVMFVGEAPGGHENATGLPFRPWAPAGSVLARAFSELGIDRSKALISNAAWYQPPRNWLEGSPWEAEYLADGRPRNAELILKYRPRVLVALGGVAWHELTGLYHTNIEQGRGYIVPARREYGGLPVIGTYHPSFIIRGSKRKNVESGARTEKQSGGGWGFYSVLKRDIALAMLRSQQDISQTVDGPGVKKFATRDDWDLAIRMCEENPNLIISYDFETPLSVLQGDESEFEKAAGSITQFQISLGEGHALVSSWDYSLMGPIKKLMELGNRKLDWNGRGFDRDIIRNLGIKFNGEWHDGMRMWSHWERDLPRGLQYVSSFVSPQDGPWKYLFEHDLRTYGVRDVIEPIKIFEFLSRQMGTMRHTSPTAKDVLWGYQRQVYTLHTQVLDPLQVRGIPINDQRRLELRECLLALEGYVNDDINVIVPEHLKPTKQAKGLKGTPKEILDAEKPRLESEATITATQEAESNGKKPTKKRIGELFKSLRADFEAGLPDRVACGETIYVRQFFPIEDQFGGIIGSEKRWGELEDFNSNSSPQLLNYIGWRVSEEKASLGANPSKAALRGMKWYIPMDFKSKKPTTEKKELDRLTSSTKDDVLKLAVEIRELRKMRSTYVEGWAPKEDMRVHPFYDDNTGTGQLTAVNPAALTFPKHLKRKIHFSPGEELGKVRGCKHVWEESRPGHYVCNKCLIPSQRYELGKLVRTIIEPRPGYRIIEADFKAFHVLTTGFEANDPDYMRLARLDMHSFIAATQLVNLAKSDDLLKLSDKDLMRVLKDFRKDERALYPGPGGIKVPFEFVRGKQAKPAILGYGFGMQPPRFYHENEEFLPSLDYAYSVFKGLDNQFPITCRWRKEIVMFVDRNNGILITRHGFVRRFSCCVDKFPVEAGYRVKPGEVIRVHSDGMHWCFGPGDDAEAIIACTPANDAFGMIKETMIRMQEQDLLEKYGLIIPIHDALVFECPDRYVDECLVTVKREMERPSEILILPNGEGLWCEAELSINKPGMSWADMEEIKI